MNFRNSHPALFLLTWLTRRAYSPSMVNEISALMRNEEWKSEMKVAASPRIYEAMPECSIQVISR